MKLEITPKEITDIYDTPIVQQTAFWPKVKQRLGVNSKAFDFKVSNRDIYPPEEYLSVTYLNSSFSVLIQFPIP